MHNKRRLICAFNNQRDGYDNVPDYENCEIRWCVIGLMTGKFQTAGPAFIGHFQITRKQLAVAAGRAFAKAPAPHGLPFAARRGKSRRC